MTQNLQARIVDYVRQNGLVVLYSSLFTAFVAFIIHYNNNREMHLVERSLLYAFVCGLPFCIGGTYRVWEAPRFKNLLPVALIAVFGIAFALFYNFSERAEFLAHMFAVACLLFLLTPAIVRKKEDVGFHWVMFTLFAIGASLTISGVFYGLLGFLTWVIKELFSYEFPKLFLHTGLAVLIVFMPINLLSFLKPAPDKLKDLRYKLPGHLKKPITLLFVPVMFTYIAVLLVYALKILLQFELPKGMVSVPISIAYILFFSLNAYLESQDREMRGLWKYRTWFQYLFIPLFVMMGVGVGVRIYQYGFTDERVYLLLAYIVMLFSFFIRIVFRRLELRLLIAFAATILLITSIGPLSPKSLEKHSQIRQFLSIAAKYGASFDKPEDFKFSTWKLSDVRSAGSALRVIRNDDGFKLLTDEGVRKGLFGASNPNEFSGFDWKRIIKVLSELDSGGTHYAQPQPVRDERLCKGMHLDHESRRLPLDVSGYDWFMHFRLNKGKQYVTPHLDGDHVRFQIDMDTLVLSQRKSFGDPEEIMNIGDQLRIYAKTPEDGALTDPVSFVVTHGAYRLKVIVWMARLDCSDPEIEADILVKAIKAKP